MNKQKIIIIILGGALFIISQYIIIEKISEENVHQQSLAFQEGYDQGLTDAVSALFLQTDNCKATTITIGNLTRTIFDLSCI